MTDEEKMDYSKGTGRLFPKGAIDIIKSGETEHTSTIIEKMLVENIETLEKEKDKLEADLKENIETLEKKKDKLEADLKELNTELTTLKVENATLKANNKPSKIFEGLRFFSGIILGAALSMFAGTDETWKNVGILLIVIFAAITVITIKYDQRFEAND